MAGKEECMEIWALERQGYSIQAIARKLAIHRKIVKKYLDAREFPAYRTVKREIGNRDKIGKKWKEIGNR